MALVQYPLLVALCVAALLYYLRLDKLEKRLHVRRIVRLHRTLGLLCLAGVGITAPPVVDQWAPLIAAAGVLAVVLLYLWATRRDWRNGQVPEYATTQPGVLEEFFSHH